LNEKRFIWNNKDKNKKNKEEILKKKERNCKTSG